MDGPMEEASFDWLRLETTAWQEIFGYLDTKSLLNASEVCSDFNKIFSSAAVLKKIKIAFRFPELDGEEHISLISERLRNHLQLTRRYQNLEIMRLRDSFLNDETEDDHPRRRVPPTDASRLRSNLMTTCEKLAHSVQVLTMKNCHILQKDVTDILRPFVHVRDLTLTNIVLSDELETIRATENFNISFPNLSSLRLSHCDFFCLLLFKSHDKLETFELMHPSYVRTDVEKLENFLLKQTMLKNLSLQNFRFNSTYSTNRLGSVPFQLKSLSLNNIKWDISNHFELFVKSQTSLKNLKLKAVHQWLPPHETNFRLFTDVLTHLLTRNQRLKTFSFDSFFYSDVREFNLLADIVNSNITELNFVARDNKSNIFEAFSRAFPSVKALKFTDHFSSDASGSMQYLQRFSHLETLDLTVAPKSLVNLNLSSDKLWKFKYCATNEEKSSITVAEFLARNSKISNLSLNIEPITFEEISEVIMCLAPTLEHFTFSELHLNQTEAELLACNFPRLRWLCSDLKLNPEITAILAASNIKFEKVEDTNLYKRD